MINLISVLFGISEFVLKVVDSISILSQYVPRKLFVHILNGRKSWIDKMSKFLTDKVKGQNQ